MKNYFYVSLIITVLFVSMFITGMRGSHDGRWQNRDFQNVVRGIAIGSISLEAIGRDSDHSPENGPLKTSANGMVTNTLSWHQWEASSWLSNKSKQHYGNWAGYADVPNKRPDTDAALADDEGNTGYQGKVNESFSRSDTDWWEYLNLADTLEECEAWASIDAQEFLNFKHSWYSHSEVPFDE